VATWLRNQGQDCLLDLDCIRLAIAVNKQVEVLLRLHQFSCDPVLVESVIHPQASGVSSGSVAPTHDDVS
jgi:hypothetical protein